MNPQVSVIIPVYNGEAFLRDAVSSALAQVGVSLEVIVVDDGSRDRSLEIAQSLEEAHAAVCLLRHPDGRNQGVSHSRGLGVASAKGEYVAFLDADDQFLPSKLAGQVEILDRYKNCVLCHSAVQTFGTAEDKFLRETEQWMLQQPVPEGVYNLRDSESFLTENHLCNSSVMVRKRALESCDFEVPQLFQHEDWLMWALLSEQGSFYYDDTPFTRYRMHQNAFTAQVRASKLTKDYSHLEFLLSLSARAEDPQIRKDAFAQATEVLASLVSAYSSKGVDVSALTSEHAVEIDPAIRARLAEYEKLRGMMQRRDRCFSSFLVRAESALRRKLGR